MGFFFYNSPNHHISFSLELSVENLVTIWADTGTVAVKHLVSVQHSHLRQQANHNLQSTACFQHAADDGNIRWAINAWFEQMLWLFKYHMKLVFNRHTSLKRCEKWSAGRREESWHGLWLDVCWINETKKRKGSECQRLHQIGDLNSVCGYCPGGKLHLKRSASSYWITKRVATNGVLTQSVVFHVF